MHHAHHVQVDDESPDVKGDLLRWKSHAHAGVVEHNIQMPVECFGGANQLRDLVKLGDIGKHGEGPS